MNFEALEEILAGKYIKTVYQPIVSLSTGQVFGYEALSRISKESLQMDISTMFKIADKAGKSWELEALCRTKALENAQSKEKNSRLFLNVNSNILYDKNFKEGLTKKYLEKHNLDFDDIIFEITERTAAVDHNAFLESVRHYKNQNYGIAIDDVGSGYSGLNTIVQVKPNYLKIDMHLIRNLDKDEMKIMMCKALVDFCRSAGISVIAEGIETEDELKTLIKLGVGFGQGYFLGVPKEKFEGIDPEKVTMISVQHTKCYREKISSSVYPRIESLCKLGHVFSKDEKALMVFETLNNNPTITEFCVVDGGNIVGFMTKISLYEAFGGKFGYSLNCKKNIGELLKSNLFKVNDAMSIDMVARLAMQRPYERLYDPIIVEKDGKYYGIVTIRDLLEASTKIEIDNAMHTNPLTGLPGNLLIEKQIVRRIFGDKPYCVIYFDIDNFKAYNDAYGFSNGDLMLVLISDILQECTAKDEFIGHIGGDDFIVICDYYEGEIFCHSVIEKFTCKMTSLYRDKDVENGYIVSKNRHGMTEAFPLASLSVAGVTNRQKAYQNVDDFSKDIAKIKKKCKQQVGNYCEIQ